MLMDTVGFILIVFCYLSIVATIFTTLFSHLNQELYGSVSVAGRTLFEALLAEFDYEDEDPEEEEDNRRGRSRKSNRSNGVS